MDFVVSVGRPEHNLFWHVLKRNFVNEIKCEGDH